MRGCHNEKKRADRCRYFGIALVWMIGWFAVVFGCLWAALAFRLKKFKTASA
jgi:hypothetical protein